MFKTLKSLVALTESKNKSIREPGWYVVDHMDKPVEGPLQERGAYERVKELNAGKSGGDIRQFDVVYYSDFDIKRMSMKEMQIDDVDQPGWYACDSQTGRVVEGPVPNKSDLSKEVLGAEGGAICIQQITTVRESLSPTVKTILWKLLNRYIKEVDSNDPSEILQYVLKQAEQPERHVISKEPTADVLAFVREVFKTKENSARFKARYESLDEGFSGFSVGESDSAADLHHFALEAAVKKLRAGLKDKGNEYNTHGTLNVAMILVEHYAKILKDDSYTPMHDLARDVFNQLTNEIKQQESKDKANKRVEGDYLKAMKSFARKLSNLIKA